MMHVDPFHYCVHQLNYLRLEIEKIAWLIALPILLE